MKANELMIGDWVLAYGKKTQIVWVGNIHKMAVRGFPREFMDGEIEPIPLTTEILEKNGFKYMTGLWYIQTKEIRPIQIVFKETNVITLSINCTPVPINLKHVHQLQHALRLYGIEKEILL